MTRICAECEHFADMYGTGQQSRCFRPREVEVDLVSGRKIDPTRSYVWYAKDVRADPGDCGPSGQFWLQRRK